MDILNEKEALKLIKRQMRESRTAALAVAFWGKGAAKELGIAERTRPVTIVCNLSHGGTNPAEIRELLTLHHAGKKRVLQNNRLHAKVYLFDDLAIVGSSNASTNGLSFEGASEISGWLELNAVVTERKALDTIRKSMRTVFKGQKIEEGDLIAAEEKWKQRRYAVKAAQFRRGKLVDVLKKSPGMLSSIFFAAYRDGLSDAGEEKQRKVKGELGKKFGLFEEWPEMPRDVSIVCFHVEDKVAPKFDGVWKVSSKRSDLENGKYQVAERRLDAGGYAIARQDHKAIWQLIRDTVEKNQQWREDRYCFFPASGSTRK